MVNELQVRKLNIAICFTDEVDKSFLDWKPIGAEPAMASSSVQEGYGSIKW